MSLSSVPSSCILLTGATGFLGKVVLENLLRIHHGNQSTRIYVLIRGKGRKTVQERFESCILNSPCFSRLPNGWQQKIEYVEGDLAQNDLGLSEQSRQRLQQTVTHIVHCAASVDFVLPIAQAAEANIDAALHLMSFAYTLPSLVRFVAVSTAYVSQVQKGFIEEQLATLPLDAEYLYKQIKLGMLRDPEILKITGHPNTYTLTKCIAEHLLVKNCRHVDLTIVRPSVISASYQYPEPGWIDSNAALAAFISLIGAGVLHVIDGDLQAQLDVVPVDWVAECIVQQIYEVKKNNYAIIHAVATTSYALSTQQIQLILNQYFGRYHVGRMAKLVHIGHQDFMYWLYDVLNQRGPNEMLQSWFRWRGKPGKASRLRRILQQVQQINDIFPYFTSHTFSFKSSVCLPKHFVTTDYMTTVCQGVFRHLLKGNPQAMNLLKVQPSTLHRYKKVLATSNHNWALRLGSIVLDSLLPRMFSQITFEQQSFEEAIENLPEGASVIFVPNHRSYVDFILISYLCFHQDHLGIRPPYVAAAKEFQQLPGLGWLMKKMHAFYIQRGQGTVDGQLNQYIEHLLASGQALEFFLEGQRSRSRHFMSPKRGLLRAIAQAKLPCYFVPICLNYDRVPEEQAYLDELKHWKKPPMHLQGLAKWLVQLSGRKVQLGRVHLRCGQPMSLDSAMSIEEFSKKLMGELQQLSSCTTFHLRAFLAAHTDITYSLQELRDLVQSKGIQVLDSDLEIPAEIDPLLLQTFNNQWSWVFLNDACAMFAANLPLQFEQKHLVYSKNLFKMTRLKKSKHFKLFLYKLFLGVCKDYEQLIVSIADHLRIVQTKEFMIQSICKQMDWYDPTSLDRILGMLVERRLIQIEGERCILLGRPEDFDACSKSCRLVLTPYQPTQSVPATAPRVAL